MQKLRQQLVKEAEENLARINMFLQELKIKADSCDDGEKDKLVALLHDYRIRYSQVMSHLVILKAKYGIFTNTDLDN